MGQQQHLADSDGGTPGAAAKLDRIRMGPADRIVAMAMVSGGVGAVCGAYLGGQLSGRQYLAERAHRLPTTVEGWFFYQKWKNYRVLLGGMKGAVRYGGRIGGCVLAYSLIEAGLDRALGEAQMASSVIAGAATAVGISLIAKLPKSSARRAGVAGLGVGLVTGAMQDGLRWKAGSPPAYIVWAQRRLPAQ